MVYPASRLRHFQAGAGRPVEIIHPLYGDDGRRRFLNRCRRLERGLHPLEAAAHHADKLRRHREQVFRLALQFARRACIVLSAGGVRLRETVNVAYRGVDLDEPGTLFVRSVGHFRHEGVDFADFGRNPV